MQSEITIRGILQQSWKTYCQNFQVVVAVVLTVWAPLELLSSYMDVHVFGEDIQKSWKFAQFLDNFFGIIATASVIFIGQEALIGQRVTFRSALATGFNSWGKMLWTRIVSRFVLVFAFLLFVLPGIYLSARLLLVEAVTVQERISGMAAVKRSYILTEGRFWFMFSIALAVGGLLVVPFVSLAFLSAAMDNWFIEAACMLIIDILGAFASITLLTVYSHLNNKPPIKPTLE